MPRNAVPGFAGRLKLLREGKGLTLTQLAEAAGMHFTAIGKLESGERQPSLEVAWRLATALGATLNDFAPPAKAKKGKA